MDVRLAGAPVSFSRHAAACLVAGAIGATVCVAVHLVQCAMVGRIGIGLAATPMLWVGTLFIALMAGGFWLTVVWPVTRRDGSARGLVAPVAVAAGAVMMNGGVAIALGKPASAFALAVFAVLGVIVGFSYQMALRRI